MMQDMMRRGGFHRYLSTNSTATSFAAPLATLVGDVLTTTQLAAYTVYPLNRCLTAEVVFVGVGADNTTALYQVWGVRSLTAVDSTLDNTGKMVIPLCSGQATFGQNVGVTSGTGILSTERIADGLTYTATATLTAAETALVEGVGGVINAGSEGIAILFLPNMARFSGLIIDIHNNSSSTSANCLIAIDDI